MKTPQDVLDYWFGAPHDSDYGQFRLWWFQKNEARDQDIRDHFLDLHRTAHAGQLKDWEESPQKAMALILVLDQFSRNMFRDTPQAFASDNLALSIAKRCIEKGWDKSLPSFMRTFFYLPFEHSEDLGVQDESIRLFQELGNASALDYAIQHHVIIERFGRFPHRNIILRRPSTPEEEEFLKTPNSSF